MGDLAKKIIDIINPWAKIERDEVRLRPVNSEVNRLLGDNSLLFKETSWKPQATLEQGLSETIEWFKQKENIKYYKDLYNI
jgi:nucleoside-diphosphate-sugar epimerase